LLVKALILIVLIVRQELLKTIRRRLSNENKL